MADETRDVERFYSTDQVVAKLRRLADALETDRPFRIQIAGERIHVPERCGTLAVDSLIASCCPLLAPIHRRRRPERVPLPTEATRIPPVVEALCRV